MAKVKLIDKFPTPEEFGKLGPGKKAFWYAAICSLNWWAGVQLWGLRKQNAFYRWINGLPLY